MPGRNTGDNKFAFSRYIVGPLLGDGCNYSTVQSAIDDCFADGGGTVLIKPGTYTENLVLRQGVDLYGAQVDGRLPSFINHVNIVGNHTFTLAAGFGAVIFNQINFSCVAGDLFTIVTTGGAQAIVACKFTGLEASANPTDRAVVLNADAISAAQFSTDNSNCGSFSHCCEAIGAGSQAMILNQGSFNSTSGAVFQHTLGSGALTCGYATLSAGTSILEAAVPNSSCTLDFCNSFSTNEIALFNGGGGVATLRDSFLNSSAASGFFVAGAGATIEFVDVTPFGSATGIDPAMTQNKLNWQPYGEAAASAGASRRGTASFNSTQFSVSDGWVSAIASGLFPWIDRGINGTVNSNEGTFIVGSPITLTLPPAPVQGDTCAFKSIGIVGAVIAANAGQTLLIGNQAGTTATNSQTGDAIELTYHAAATVWVANSLIGNWLVA